MFGFRPISFRTHQKHNPLIRGLVWTISELRTTTASTELFKVNMVMAAYKITITSVAKFLGKPAPHVKKPNGKRQKIDETVYERTVTLPVMINSKNLEFNETGHLPELFCAKYAQKKPTKEAKRISISSGAKG